MNSVEIEQLANELSRKVKSYLISTIGRTVEEACAPEFYRALCYAIREQTMINWMATTRTIAARQARMVYYFSMEYLPGRLFLNNITNLLR
jgi:starch phosphorylase